MGRPANALRSSGSPLRLHNGDSHKSNREKTNSLFSALDWLFMELVAVTPSHTAIAYWNACMRLGLYANIASAATGL